MGRVRGEGRGGGGRREGEGRGERGWDVYTCHEYINSVVHLERSESRDIGTFRMDVASAAEQSSINTSINNAFDNDDCLIEV